MVRLSQFLCGLLLFAGAIANPVLPPTEYDIAVDSEGTNLRRSNANHHDDDCHNLKPITLTKTKTTVTTHITTVPKTVISKTVIKSTRTKTLTSTTKVTATVKQTPSTVTVYTNTKTTSTHTIKVPGTLVTTLFTTVTPTKTRTTTTTTTVTVTPLKARWHKGDKCHRPTVTTTKWVTSTTHVTTTSTTTKPVTVHHVDRKTTTTTTTITDTTVTIPATTTFTRTKVTKTYTIIKYSRTTEFRTTTTTKTRHAHPTWTLTTTTTTTTVKPIVTGFCDNLKHKTYYSDLDFTDQKGGKITRDFPEISDLKECCMKCQSLSNNACQWMGVKRNGGCKVFYAIEGPKRTRSKQCPAGKISIEYDDGRNPKWLGHAGPCASNVHHKH